MVTVSSTLTLAISLALIVGLAYYSIRFVGKRAQGLTGNRLLRFVSAHSLGTNKTLQVLVVDEKTVLLLGVGANVECVARFDDPELAGRLLQQGGAGVSSASGAAAAMGKVISRFRKVRSEEVTDFSALLHERMDQVARRRMDLYADLSTLQEQVAKEEAARNVGESDE